MNAGRRANLQRRLRRRGILDLTGISGHDTLPAMELNVAQYERPKDGKRLERFPN
jgi:4-carboxymuconolactone decarboxylase